MTRTYLDASVLIAYIRGTPEIAERVQELLDDPNREFVSTSVLELEVLPQAERNKKITEVAFYEAYFEKVEFPCPIDDALIRRAHRRMVKLPGLQVVDSMHLEAAVSAGADEFITDEKHTKPFFSETDVRVTRLTS